METLNLTPSRSELLGSESTKSEATLRFVSAATFGIEPEACPGITMDSGEQLVRVCSTARRFDTPELTVDVAIALSQLPRTFPDLPYAEDDDL